MVTSNNNKKRRNRMPGSDVAEYKPAKDVHKNIVITVTMPCNEVRPQKTESGMGAIPTGLQSSNA